MAARTWASMAIVLALLAGAEAAEPVLRLSGIPDRLVLPLPEGSNAIVTAAVQGAEPRSVWLATSSDAKLKYTLSKTAPGEYQANLAEPEVEAALKTAAGRGRFQVFAELGDGKVLASISVNYTFRPAPAGPADFRLEIVLKDKEPVVRRPEHQDPFSPAAFFTPDATTRVEFLAEDAVPPAVRACAGDKAWEFRKGGDPAHLRLDLTDDIRRQWLDRGELRVEYQKGKDWLVAERLHVRPARLDFPGSVASMTLHQRGSKAMPGSHDYLWVNLGDVTHGQVHITVRNAESKTVIDSTSVRRGESLTLEYGGEQYVLYVRELVNVLIGEDWAVLDISRMESAELEGIERLLARMETADVRFIREGREYSGKEAAQHLRQKLGETGPRVKTLDEFIDQIAGRSSLTGNPYQVKRPEGTTLPAKDWLRAEAAKPAPKPADDAGAKP